MAETWYRINPYVFRGTKIQRVQVDRETASQVVVLTTQHGKVKKNRHFKRGEYFKTFEEAKAYLLGMTDGRVKQHAEALSRAQRDVEQYSALTEESCENLL